MSGRRDHPKGVGNKFPLPVVTDDTRSVVLVPTFAPRSVNYFPCLFILHFTPPVPGDPSPTARHVPRPWAPSDRTHSPKDLTYDRRATRSPEG